MSRASEHDVLVFDHTRGVRSERLHEHERPFLRGGLFQTRRRWRAEAIGRVEFELRSGLGLSATARRLKRATAVLDVSGGDSFTDLYGAWRFRSIMATKRLALLAGARLILLPQTYGPFESSEARGAASEVVRRAAMAWARDERSYATLRELLGDAFDPGRHKTGVDLAFLLERLEPADLDRATGQWLREGGPIAGLNVSGLIHNQPDRAQEQYGLALDYREVVRALADRILEDREARLLLVPHVAPTRADSIESDERACRELAADLERAGAGGRVFTAPAYSDPRHAKWLISRCDWFCGTRMHSTIAGLSSGVPTSSLAYSGKTQGVFETCGQGAWVADMRSIDGPEAVERMWRSWHERAAVRISLREHMPAVLERAARQMDEIVAGAIGHSAD